MHFATLLLAIAISQGGPSSSGPQNVVTHTVSPDGGGLTWYVDVRGLDTNTCTQPFTDGGKNGPCRQPQAAANKIPKGLRHQVTVSVDAGTYDCLYVHGFTCDTGRQTVNSGFLLDGVIANSTNLATGSATGTATSTTAGSGTTWGTLTDLGAAWTPNDLMGRFITSAAQTRVISSNTATAITIVGTWTSPGAVAYAIQDSQTEFNTACPVPGTPTIAAAAGQGAAIMASNNNCRHAAGSMVIRGIRTTNPTGGGVLLSDPQWRLTLSQIRSPTNPGYEIGQASVSNGPGVGGNVVIDCDFLSASGNDYIRLIGATSAISLTRILVRGGARGIGAFGGPVNLNGIDLFGQTQYGLAASGNATQLLVSGAGVRATCASSAGVGIAVGVAGTSGFASPAFAQITVAPVISTCGTGITIGGGAGADLAGLTGAAATTGILVTTGSRLSYLKSATTLTVPTEISLDPASTAPLTSTFAGITTGSCLATSAAGYYSRACAR